MKKSKILATILAISLIVASMPMGYTVFSVNAETVTSFAGGDGTEENPYQISNAVELNNFSEYVNSQEATNSRVCDEEYFILTNDIYLNEKTEYSTWSDTVAPSANAQKWTAAGKASAGFAGEFNGDGYTIYGLYCESTTAKETGLFGEVRGTAAIKNVTLSNAYLSTTADGAGGFIGYAVPTAIGTPLTISNCGFSGIIKSSNKKAGGLVGYVSSTNAGAKFLMENCWSEGSLSANTNCGGLVGEFTGPTKTAAEINNCYSAMTISHLGTSVIGGLVGRIIGSSSTKTTTTLKISNSHFAGNISANTPIVGKPSYFSGSMTLENVYFKSGSYSDTAAYVSTDSSVKLTATNVAEKTADEFIDGTVKDLLNGDTNEIWSQGEKYPVFKKEVAAVEFSDDFSAATGTENDWLGNNWLYGSGISASTLSVENGMAILVGEATRANATTRVVRPAEEARENQKITVEFDASEFNKYGDTTLSSGGNDRPRILARIQNEKPNEGNPVAYFADIQWGDKILIGSLNDGVETELFNSNTTEAYRPTKPKTGTYKLEMITEGTNPTKVTVNYYETTSGIDVLIKGYTISDNTESLQNAGSAGFHITGTAKRAIAYTDFSYFGNNSPDVIPTADLTDLTLNVGDLVFDNNTNTYNMTVENDITEVVVTPTANPSSVIKVNGAVVESGTQSEAIALDTGLTTITIFVSEGMFKTKTYTINIVKNIKNDLNADYVFDINDVLVLKQILLDIPVENVIAENIDVNGDGFEDVCDLVALDNELL